MPKSTNPKRYLADTPQTKERIALVIQKIRKGWSNKKLYDWIMDNFDTNKQQAWKYVHDAYILLQEHADATIENAKAIQIERVEDLLADALESNDRNTALRALEMINRLFNLYIEKREVDVSVNDIKFEFGETQE